MRILFVCTGNTCRSPMAQAYAAERLRQAGCSSVCCASAGLAACAGAPASPAAIAVMKQYGISLDGFRSSRVSLHLLESADMIITMTAAQRQAVCSALPEMAGKVSVLCGNADVPDPYGGNEESYRTVFEFMRPALDRIISENI